MPSSPQTPRYPIVAARRTVKSAIDFASGALAVVLAVMLSEPASRPGSEAVLTLALVVGALVAALNGLAGGHRHVWSYTGVREILVFGGTGALTTGVLLAARAGWGLPLATDTVVLVGLLLFMIGLGVRTLRRLQVEQIRKRQRRLLMTVPTQEHRVLVLGADETGMLVARELQHSAPPGVRLIGFLDDDRSKLGNVVCGAPILGRLDELTRIAEDRRIDEVVIASPEAARADVRPLVRRVEESGVRVSAAVGGEVLFGSAQPYRPGDITLAELATLDAQVPAAEPRTAQQRKSVLVTGGAGFIGAHLTRMLLDRGYEVRVLDSFAYGRHGLEDLERHPQLQLIDGDICNLRDVSRAVRGVDGVIALAAIVGDPACSLDPEETLNLNYASTKLLIETCNMYGVGRLVFASSCSVYGASEDGELTERSRLNPVSLYARTRVLSENIIFDRRGEVEPVILRLSTVFGLSPRMRFDLVVNTLTVRAVVDGRIAIFGGDQWRPNVHCRDAARAFLMALEADGRDVSGQVFNVGGSALNHRIADIGTMVADIVGDVEVTMRDDVTDRRNYRVNFDKIERVLGFKPEYSVADGIREVAAAVRAREELRTYQHPLFHNVQALRHRLAGEPMEELLPL
ncbi:NAD-dependent epimerase/dehydratase family protein [Roseisolibacter agri]|uniref:Rhodanese domain-containing protein n=1 Tax=Roseisolibacter agri TaxID=2014610 RepID=A0AA37QBY8_9BACT|nr:NAD-dependent epimerase/dehydratase family protein [Roseisolibacter agri]GLC27482.1 hypothetical protein rosag_39950 [Roseisolibacter agri]